MISKKISIVFVALLFLSACSFGPELSEYELSYVIDGDSFYVTEIGDQDSDGVEGERVEVRLIGLDAPEYKQTPWGPIARKFLWQLLGAKGSKVFLEFDVEKFDKYGRSLAYAYSAREDLVNESMLQHGFASTFFIGLNKKHREEFKTAQSVAQSKNLNIWNPEKGLQESPYEYRQKMKKLKAKSEK